MKVSDRVRISYSNLIQLADYFRPILGLKRADLRKELSDIDSTTFSHALAINRYAKKHKKVIRSMVKKKGLDDTFFEVAKDVLADRESLDKLTSARAILDSIREVIDRQQILLDDLTYLEKDEFKHLEAWGLKHKFGKKKRVHINDFVHKLEKKLNWSKDPKVNDKNFERFVEEEKDIQLRDTHLYIIYLIELKREYDLLKGFFTRQLKHVKTQEKHINDIKKKAFDSVLFHRHCIKALGDCKLLEHDILLESQELSELITILKEVQYHFPKLEEHAKTPGPYLHVSSHPVQVEGYPKKHPHLLSLPHLMKHFNTGVVVFGEAYEFCHVLLHHSSKIHFHISKAKRGYLLFNQPGSPGLFVRRGKSQFAIINSTDEKRMLKQRIQVGSEEYADMIHRKKLQFKISKKGFLLKDDDKIIAHPGYEFIFSAKK